MTPEEVVKHCRTKSAAYKLAQVTRMTWYWWEQYDEIPIERQCLIEIATQGKLKADRRLLA